MPLRNHDGGYGLVTKSLHWLTVMTLSIQFVVGYVMDDGGGEGRGRGRGRGDESGRGRGRGRAGDDELELGLGSGDDVLITVHVGLGLTIVALAVVRGSGVGRRRCPPGRPGCHAGRGPRPPGSSVRSTRACS